MVEIKLRILDEAHSYLCELYWEVDEELNFSHKVAEIALLEDLPSRDLYKLIQSACEAYVTKYCCSQCGQPYIFTNRSDFNSRKKHLLSPNIEEMQIVCDNCRKERVKIQNEEKEKEDEDRRNWIRETFDLSFREPLDISSLSLQRLLYLYSLIIFGGAEDLSKINSINLIDNKLSPTIQFDKEIVNELFNNRIIYIHPDSSIDAFSDDLSEFYIFKVDYALPICSETEATPKSLISQILRKINGNWPEQWYSEALALWQKIALEESKEFLLYSLKNHGFNFKPGEKTDQILTKGLQTFSTGQLFNFIWRSAKDAAAYYQRGSVAKKHAANSAITNLQRQIDRAIVEQWEIKPYGRNYDLPQTTISQIAYDVFLGIGEDGFNLAPNIKTIMNAKGY